MLMGRILRDTYGPTILVGGCAIPLLPGGESKNVSFPPFPEGVTLSGFFLSLADYGTSDPFDSLDLNLNEFF